MEGVRWRNFRSLADTKWRSLRPLTVVIGPNNSGKTSFIAPLLLLQQTLDSEQVSTALLSRGPLLDLGVYTDLVRNHDPGARVEFSMKWQGGGRAKDADRPTGAYPPGAITLSFERDDDDGIRLHRLVVRDVFGRKVLQRTRRRTGSYSLEHLPEIVGASRDTSAESASGGADEVQDKVWRQIKRSRPSRFMFDATSPLMKVATEQAGDDEDGSGFVTPDLGSRPMSYWAIAETARHEVFRELQRLTYVGPLREPARRLYQLSGEMPRNVGTRGEFAPEILFRWRDSEKRALVQEWLKRFGFSDPLVLEAQGPGAFSLSWRTEAEHGTDTAFVDMGFGLSQVLPLIVQAVMSRKGSTIIAEQPEIHLNPRLQTVLAELFAFCIDRGVRVVTETHSEHLLLAVRRLIAEKELEAADLGLYFVERIERDSSIREVKVEKNGHIRRDEWPVGFFADALRESLALASAQSE